MSKQHLTIRLKLGEGILLRDVPVSGNETGAALRNLVQESLQDGDKRLGITVPGACFTAKPTYKALGTPADRDDPDMLLLIGWDACLQGYLTEHTMQAMACLAPVCMSAEDDGSILSPAQEGAAASVTSLCWVGDTCEGTALVLLPNAVSTGGISVKPGQKQQGMLPFSFRAMAEPGEECFRLLLTDRAAAEACDPA